MFIYHYILLYVLSFFFFNATATTAIHTLSLHDALPICGALPDTEDLHFHLAAGREAHGAQLDEPLQRGLERPQDRKSTRLNSSHVAISYAVFCLKKKNKIIIK